MAEERWIPIREACERLQISTRAFRKLYKEHQAHLPPLGEQDGLKVVSESALNTLLNLQAYGAASAEVAAAIAVEGSAHTPAGLEPGISERFDELLTEFRRSEERQLQDRDRFTLMLMRLQQEVQHLRYELAANSSRRDRKRGFWQRLHGRG